MCTCVTVCDVVPQVNEGSGHVLVVAVGVNSEWGKTMTLVSEAGEDLTPLQVRRSHFAGTNSLQLALSLVAEAVAEACVSKASAGEVGCMARTCDVQEKLAWVATQISKLGLLVAVVVFLALFIKWLVENKVGAQLAATGRATDTSTPQLTMRTENPGIVWIRHRNNFHPQIEVSLRTSALQRAGTSACPSLRDLIRHHSRCGKINVTTHAGL
jgi:hypothetical protein